MEIAQNHMYSNPTYQELTARRATGHTEFPNPSILWMTASRIGTEIMTAINKPDIQVVLAQLDLEYAELKRIVHRPLEQEMSLTISAPELNWYLRSKLTGLRRLFGSAEEPLEVQQTFDIIFTNVSIVAETLLSYGHRVRGLEARSDWMKELVFEIDDVRNEALTDGKFMFSLDAEDLTLKFTYSDYQLKSS